MPSKFEGFLSKAWAAMSNKYSHIFSWIRRMMDNSKNNWIDHLKKKNPKIREKVGRKLGIEESSHAWIVGGVGGTWKIIVLH